MGFVRIDVEHFDIDHLIRVHIAAQMAVDQLQPAVGQFIGKQAARKANLRIKRLQGSLLMFRVRAEVQFMRDQVAGAHAAVVLDAISYLVLHGRSSQFLAEHTEKAESPETNLSFLLPLALRSPLSLRALRETFFIPVPDDETNLPR